MATSSKILNALQIVSISGFNVPAFQTGKTVTLKRISDNLTLTGSEIGSSGRYKFNSNTWVGNWNMYINSVLNSNWSGDNGVYLGDDELATTSYVGNNFVALTGSNQIIQTGLNLTGNSTVILQPYIDQFSSQYLTGPDQPTSLVYKQWVTNTIASSTATLTGAFVDTTSNQQVAGIKTFTSGISGVGFAQFDSPYINTVGSTFTSGICAGNGLVWRYYSDARYLSLSALTNTPQTISGSTTFMDGSTGSGHNFVVNNSQTTINSSNVSLTGSLNARAGSFYTLQTQQANANALQVGSYSGEAFATAFSIDTTGIPTGNPGIIDFHNSSLQNLNVGTTIPVPCGNRERLVDMTWGSNLVPNFTYNSMTNAARSLNAIAGYEGDLLLISSGSAVNTGYSEVAYVNLIGRGTFKWVCPANSLVLQSTWKNIKITPDSARDMSFQNKTFENCHIYYPLKTALGVINFNGNCQLRNTIVDSATAINFSGGNNVIIGNYFRIAPLTSAGDVYLNNIVSASISAWTF